MKMHIPLKLYNVDNVTLKWYNNHYKNVKQGYL